MKDLLQPRFIVTNDYPQSIFEKEQIITPDNGTTYIEYSDNGGKIEIVLADYPHLFRPLHWSEFRTINEMPKYVKSVHPQENFVGEFRNFSNEDETSLYTFLFKGSSIPRNRNYMMPATETEYNNFINQEK